jgi:hypothetical protein
VTRVAAVSLAFNVSAWVQKGHISRTKGDGEEAVDGSGQMKEREENVEGN